MKYYSLNEYLKDTYNRKIYKISLDAGLSCPNRDGRIGYGGCIFCNGGSGDFASDRAKSVTEQIVQGRELVAGKLTKHISTISEPSYIAYFQAYTNTYGPVDYLEKIYMEAIENPDIVGISIATRPDCLGEDVLKLIDKCNSIKPVWVELGLQTMHEATARYIRRGYELEVYDRAVSSLLNIGIPQVITHVILGLPGEDASMMSDTVRHVVATGSNGIKLQLLHVLRGTDLEKEYNEGHFSCLSLEEYTDIVIDCLKLLPADMVVHRLTGDGNKKSLVAPLWSGDKKKVLNYMAKRIAMA